jgi:hypothetical protein
MTDNTDESNMPQPASANFLMDNAIGANGFYGMFTILIHTDIAVNADSDAVIASAKSKSVPVISAKQALDWVDGRDRSTFRNFSWNGSTVGFTINVGSGANGLRAMLPTTANGKTLTSISRGGTNVPFTTQTIKGIGYAFFDAAAGGYSATYS